MMAEFVRTQAARALGALVFLISLMVAVPALVSLVAGADHVEGESAATLYRPGPTCS